MWPRSLNSWDSRARICVLCFPCARYGRRRTAHAKKNDGEAVHLAAKWAGKEAFLKAWCDFLGSAPFPFTLDNFPWREIEILDDSRGVPHVSLSGDASPAFQTDYSGSIPDVRISLSHDGPVASAVVMIQSGNDSREIR
ncbi:Holo-[acyl-carrier protein] synthase, belongs to 4-phosphopantetheinyl transferase superfamily [Bifidobacterium breve 31L]|nr:Holo-[acyl-carrier protein] synthase, belongs to 4-phosphopantetheinyl transferase superfamily [Bifidobacterium breve 31L]